MVISPRRGADDQQDIGLLHLRSPAPGGCRCRRRRHSSCGVLSIRILAAERRRRPAGRWPRRRRRCRAHAAASQPPPPRISERALGLGQQIAHGLHARPAPGSGSHGLVGAGVGDRRRVGQHVFRQREHDRARAAGDGAVEGAGSPAPARARIVDLRRPFGERRRTCGGSRPPERPRARRSRSPTWPMNRIIGVESWKAVCTPIEALVAPGPRVTKQMPGRPVSLP